MKIGNANVKRIAILPTLLTLGNGICGFASVVIASRINLNDVTITPQKIDTCFAAAGWFLIAAMVFDMLDGYVARLSKTASKFGGELDSLCDAASFGFAPAFLLLKLGPPDWQRAFLHQLTFGIAALYFVCTLLRLARFNVENSPDPASHKRFRGLPSPGAAGCLASLAILRGELPSRLSQLGFWPDIEPDKVRETVQRLIEGLSPFGALVVALLMVSVVPFPHATNQILRGKRHVRHLIQLLLAVFLIVLFYDVAAAVIFWGYALIFPLRYLAVRAIRREVGPTPDVVQH